MQRIRCIQVLRLCMLKVKRGLRPRLECPPLLNGVHFRKGAAGRADNLHDVILFTIDVAALARIFLQLYITYAVV